MRLLMMALVLPTLGACSLAASDNPGNVDRGRGGRYVGVGIYDPDQLWAQQNGKGDVTGADARLANLNDDGKIIVVTDSQTGEVRQCGNLSGRCIVMNPWGAPRPVALDKHRAQLEEETERAAKLQEAK